MARRTGGTSPGFGGGMMAPVLSIATGLLIFVILIVFAPTIAGSVQEAQPAPSEVCGVGDPAGGTTDWVYQACTGDPAENVTEYDRWLNTTEYTDIPDGVSTWTTNIQILGVVVLIISIAIAMYYLKGMA
jgi:hypothetical protein